MSIVYNLSFRALKDKKGNKAITTSNLFSKFQNLSQSLLNLFFTFNQEIQACLLSDTHRSFLVGTFIINIRTL